MKKSSYLIIFLCSYILIAPFVIKVQIDEFHKNNPSQTQEESQVGSSNAEESSTIGSEESIVVSEADTEPSSEITMPQESSQTEEIEPSVTQDAPETIVFDRTFFDNSLFIGDSRTMGLCQYGDVGNADVFADTGLSVFGLFSAKNGVDSPDGTKAKLEDMLAARQYKRIYLMLGINELGYNFDKTVEKYQEVVQTIQQLQPGADLVLELNQHVTDSYSKKNPVYSNDKINKMNEAIQCIADDNNLFTLNVNVLFDDESGALNPNMTFDKVHVFVKHYKEWVDWILQMEEDRYSQTP